jgi:hypothetical protein
VVRRVEQDRFLAWLKEYREYFAHDLDDPESWGHMALDFLASERRARIWRRIQERMDRRGEPWLRFHATNVHTLYGKRSRKWRKR